MSPNGTLNEPTYTNQVQTIQMNLLFSRSKDFRPAYSRLAELRALVPSRTPFMACTATATKSDKMEVLESLEMGGCVEVSVSPDRPNIYYEARARTDLEADFEGLLSSLSTQAIHAPRVIVYCPSLCRSVRPFSLRTRRIIISSTRF